eukprot:gene2778-5471_t
MKNKNKRKRNSLLRFFHDINESNDFIDWYKSASTETETDYNLKSFQSLLGQFQQYDSVLVNNHLRVLLFEVKDAFGLLGKSQYLHIRGRVNPYECLGKGPSRCFINRSAMKLANIDNIFHFIPSYSTKTETPFKFLDLCGGPGGFVEYILQRCYSIKQYAIGFGMSLKHPSDTSLYSCNWKLQHMSYPPDIEILSQDSNETSFLCKDTAFLQFYIIDGPDNDGNIYSINNIKFLQQFIQNKLPSYSHSYSIETNSNPSRPSPNTSNPSKEPCKEEILSAVSNRDIKQLLNPSTHNNSNSNSNNNNNNNNNISNSNNSNSNNTNTITFLSSSSSLSTSHYVHFVTADGGLDESPNPNDQEHDANRIISCQIAAMVMNLCTGGDFMLKLFSMYEMSTAELFSILCDIFHAVTITKPITSRPANNERYVICRHMKPMSASTRATIANYLMDRHNNTPVDTPVAAVKKDTNSTTAFTTASGIITSTSVCNVSQETCASETVIISDVTNTEKHLDADKDFSIQYNQNHSDSDSDSDTAGFVGSGRSSGSSAVIDIERKDCNICETNLIKDATKTLTSTTTSTVSLNSGGKEMLQYLRKRNDQLILIQLRAGLRILQMALMDTFNEIDKCAETNRTFLN